MSICPCLVHNYLRVTKVDDGIHDHDPEPAVPAVPVDVGPASFIDSDRVNAVPSLELDTDTEDTADTSINILQHIPEVELQTNLREV